MANKSTFIREDLISLRKILILTFRSILVKFFQHPRRKMCIMSEQDQKFPKIHLLNTIRLQFKTLSYSNSAVGETNISFRLSNMNITGVRSY